MQYDTHFKDRYKYENTFNIASQLYGWKLDTCWYLFYRIAACVLAVW